MWALIPDSSSGFGEATALELARPPHDPDARVAKMKDGRTHLAHEAEHAVDLETAAVVAVTVQGADQGDTTTV
ncbi:MAG: hypothetical protein HY648_07745 [Acidobacteria bacterium]|nr:hypothetical protein [Acidobacteriota bacterium]